MEEALTTTEFPEPDSGSGEGTAANRFGRTSKLFLRAALQDGRTILKDVSFTAPYKVMTPFPGPGGGIKVMPLCASAGLMRGDRQELTYEVDAGADLEVLSQAFDKIHKMEGGCASRRIRARVAPGAVLQCAPQPVIPFAGSAFESRVQIALADETSRLYYLEILCAGRGAYHEEFAYRRFVSKVEITRGGRLIYRDNTCYEPSKMPMRGLGLFEGYTHLANIFLSKPSPGVKEHIRELLEAEDLDGAVTTLADADLAVRIFSSRAQVLTAAAESIRGIWEMH